ncbi:hypothetical protein B0T25DRAFT_133159 [Lasiosphaeria hispida]|uniref:Uncharacterized protein n=1 Tax=Lasiosphaeria hispida TaxID=260671 RepID=A0AAJ0HT28_9PEZI|nr:hypothetical protein B0T25DRAFT_133159 [Lasiosphaeria hispida]
MLRSGEWHPPRPIGSVPPFEGRCLAVKRKPFLDQQPINGDPPRTWSNFRHSLLRQLPPCSGFGWKE